MTGLELWSGVQELLNRYHVPAFVLPLTLALVTLMGIVYQRAKPRPLPGIPYNAEALHSVLGDVPSMIEWKRQNGEQRRWYQAQAVKLNAPIIQVFTKPFYKPQVVLVDHKEIYDIFHRRHREFDKGYKEAEAFGGIIPDELLSYKLASSEYRYHKELMKDLMLPAFLQKVNAPEIYAKAMLLVDLWRIKAKSAGRRPFSGKDDVHKAALDIILAVSFGLDEENCSIKKQLERTANQLSSLEQVSSEGPYEFDEVPLETEPAAITTLAASVEVGFNSPLPVQHHWVLRQLPHLGGAIKIKNNMTRREISKSLSRMPEDDEEAQLSARTALDNMLFRERLTARKSGKKPNFYASYIFDEMLAYVIAGHDTTANTLTWGLVYLADNQQPQTRLRDELQAVFLGAITEKRQPTVQEIIKAQAPYLDATIEEILRCSVVLPNVTREALVNTAILGHPIPKGTLVMCLSNGPSFFSRGIPVDDELRSASSKAASESSLGSWDPDNMHLFMPERWLEENQSGETIFNGRKGPMNSFGGGPRGCFGKRLAYLEMRVVIVLLFYNFKLLSVPPELRSYKRVEHITVEPAECLVSLEEAPLWANAT